MAEDHRAILLSILATALAGTGLLIITIAVSGGVSLILIKGYVLPLYISAFTLSIYWIILFSRSKGKFPWLGPVDSHTALKESMESAPRADDTTGSN